MDEVDGNSRDTSTEGSSGGLSHIRTELNLPNSEVLQRPHSSWPSSQPPEETIYNPLSRAHNISWSGRTDVIGGTNFSHGPTAVSNVHDQFDSQLAMLQSELSRPASLAHRGERNTSENSLFNFLNSGGEDTKLPETQLPLRHQEEVLLREDYEPPFVGSGLNSGMCRPQSELRSGLTFELKSDINPQYYKDRCRDDFFPKSGSEEVSLQSFRQNVQPPRQLDLREHLPKPVQPGALRQTDRNSWMQGNLASHRSMTGSFVQQCSDMNDCESIGQAYGYEASGYSLSRETRDGYNGAGHLERVIQNQDELLRARDVEILELKGANHRQSLFIEKVLAEKRLLESTVVEQARLLMTEGAQCSNAEPVRRQTVIGSGATFDSHLYEAQLATYKEDFENERKEKLLIKGSADSLMEQLTTVLNQLRLAQDKLKATEEELDRYKNPYRAAYQPYLQSNSSHPNRTASSTWSSQSSTTAAGQNKTPLYRKPDNLEPDRMNETILSRPNHMDYMSQMTTGRAPTVKESKLTKQYQPHWTKEIELNTKSDHMWQRNVSSTTKTGKEFNVNRNEMKDAGQVKQIEEMSLTTQRHQILVF